MFTQLIQAETSQDQLPPFPVRRWTLDEYHALVDQGMFDDERVELLEGYIVPKMTRNPLHESTLPQVVAALQPNIASSMHLRVQSALTARESEPEPDVAIIAGKTDDYRSRHPGKGDVLLVVEVADSSLRRDRVKASIYAEMEVPQYWIIDLQHQQVEVFSNPRSGGYSALRVCQRGELIVAHVGNEECEIMVNSLLLPDNDSAEAASG
jgi:Uma2 family endonuclease